MSYYSGQFRPGRSTASPPLTRPQGLGIHFNRLMDFFRLRMASVHRNSHRPDCRAVLPSAMTRRCSVLSRFQA